MTDPRFILGADPIGTVVVLDTEADVVYPLGDTFSASITAALLNEHPELAADYAGTSTEYAESVTRPEDWAVTSIPIEHRRGAMIGWPIGVPRG